DDWLVPTCIAELVRVAEAHASVGMVTSYVLSGAHIGWDGLPYPSTFMSGREVCRLRLLRDIKVFGGPSASLIRADIVRRKRPFYNPLNYHGDSEAYLDLLRDHDFGFVHQVLSYNRRGEASRTTSYLERVDSYPAADLDELTKFGPIYLTETEPAPGHPRMRRSGGRPRPSPRRGKRRPVRFTETAIPGAWTIEPAPHADARGRFLRAWCAEEFAAQGIAFTPQQANLGSSRQAGTVRGLHYQVEPHLEAKLMRCTRGSVFDVLVDLRPGSRTFGRWFGTELTAENARMLFIPPLCAHGYQTLENEAEIYYLTSAAYAPAAVRGLRFDDPTVAI